VQQRILVTGASRGIGFEYTRQFASRGDRVFAGARSPDTATQLRRLADEHPDLVSIVEMDAADEQSITAAHEAIAAEVDGLDLLINNAGILSTVIVGGVSGEQVGGFDFAGPLEVFRTNAVAPLIVAQVFLDLLMRGRNPRLVSLTSNWASISRNTGGFPYYYSASKAALNQFMRSFASDPATRGITTIVVNPGWVKTDMGADGASVEPEDSVGGLIRIIDGLTPADNSRFFNWQGEEEAW
jgi:NAD(P)-dependent dehydrogenase (short-subunit alcohol dehydrogenase family)